MAAVAAATVVAAVTAGAVPAVTAGGVAVTAADVSPGPGAATAAVFPSGGAAAASATGAVAAGGFEGDGAAACFPPLLVPFACAAPPLVTVPGGGSAGHGPWLLAFEAGGMAATVTQLVIQSVSSATFCPSVCERLCCVGVFTFCPACEHLCSVNFFGCSCLCVSQ